MKKNLLTFGMVLAGAAMLAQTPRMSLYEEFTGETCPPCAATNPGLNAILLAPVNQTKIIPLKWQVPIPSAPANSWSLYKTNQAEIDWRYRSTTSGGYGYPSQNTAATAITSGINSAPAGRIDGQHQWTFGAASDHPAYMNNNVITTAQAIPASFSIDMRHEWDATLSAVVVSVNITCSQNFTSVGALKFRCVMVERLIQFSVQPGTNGEKSFEDVVIKSYPTLQNGTSMASAWTTGQTQNFVLTCPVPTYIRDKNQISMVGFIQDDGDRKVAQAARSQALYDASAVSVKVGPVCGTSFAPVVTIKNEGMNAITNMTVTPSIDNVAGNTTTWSGNLAPGASTTMVLNAVASPATDGSHNFSFNISALNGVDFKLANNVAKVSFVTAQNGGVSTNVVEPFAATLFPPSNWTSVNADNSVTFSRTTLTGAYFQLPWQCMKYDFFNNTTKGDIDEMFLPPMDLKGGDAVEMSFDYAYGQKVAADDDKLEVMASSDCGANWTTVFSQSGSNLATAQPVGSVAYVPNDQNFDEWRTVVVSLPGMNQGSVLVKFVVTSDNGNNLYIDNVNLAQKNPSGIQAIGANGFNTTVYPNPSNGVTKVRISVTSETNVGITVMNTLGQVVLEQNKNISAGTSEIPVDLRDQANGIYNVVINAEGRKVTHRLNLAK
jgi:hypothetical protein